MTSNPCRQPVEQTISAFITLLWDLGLEIGSSVRSQTECMEAAREDITIATNLMESRTLIGPVSRCANPWWNKPDPNTFGPARPSSRPKR
jgi:UTP:GlnB (protein PII) uridylyltransferase